MTPKFRLSAEVVIFAALLAAPSVGVAQQFQGVQQIAPGGSRVQDATQIPGAERSGQAGAIEQSARGQNRCDPSISAAERKRLGIDCEALLRDAARHGSSETDSGVLQDEVDEGPLDSFKDLGLDSDVPSTVILQ